MRDLIRFGPFELDLEAAELRTDGRSVRLPEQQFLILQMLLLAEGGVVSREEIRKRLWPNDTVVEFDRSINAAIMKLRAALGDTGDEPRFIETLVRRGYRLMVPVEGAQGGPSETSIRQPLPNSLIGKKVSHYRVLGILGGGGMGLVYKGEDLKLNRPVALKFLPDEMASDPQTVQRFEREARTASSLNHPNICTIYEVEEYDGQPFIVMELLEGETLRELIARFADPVSERPRGLPLSQLVDIAVQMAEGLNAAHQKGIIHRDIKPANIFVTPSGRVKILDFGLAKAAAETVLDLPGETGERDSQLPSSRHENIDLTLSRTGITMGTAGYMSPEQVRGEKLDARTDLFSFGLILFEMATDKRAFSGDTAAIVQHAILNQPLPPVRELNPELPVALEAIIGKALEKDRDARYGTAAEMLADLLRVKPDITTGKIVAAMPALVATPRMKKGIWLWGSMAATVMLVAAAAIWYFTPEPLPRVTGSTQLTYGSYPLLSGKVADDVRLYFIENRGGVRELAQMSVTGGDVSSLPVSISAPVIEDISPDHSQLLISTSDALNAPFWTLPLPSGSPRRFGDIEASSASWAPDGKHLVFTKDSDVYLAEADGSDAKRIVSGAKGRVTSARFSPDESRIRFDVTGTQDNSVTLWEVRPDGSHLQRLLASWRGPLDPDFSWTPDGRYFVFASEAGNGAHDIFAMREPRGLFRKQPGKPIRLTFGPLRFEAPVFSPDGKKLFVFGWHQRGELDRYDSATKQFTPFLGGISATDVAFSRDGKWIAYVSIPSNELWRSRVDGTEKMQLTSASGSTSSRLPNWSPDGKQIAFMSRGLVGDPWKIFLIPADGGKPQPLLSGTSAELDPTWSADGTRLAFGTGTVFGGKSDIEIVDMNTRKVSAVPGSSGMFSPRWSPDGRYLAALSFELLPKKLFLYDVQTQNWTQWATDVDMGYLSWTADSRYVRYVQNAGVGRSSKIRSVRVGNSNPEDLFSLNGLRQFDELLGQWSSTAPDGSQMFVRDTSGRDIYALDVDFP
jgi:serine/threonine protein kinase/Tol biopolymer transport system component